MNKLLTTCAACTLLLITACGGGGGGGAAGSAGGSTSGTSTGGNPSPSPSSSPVATNNSNYQSLAEVKIPDGMNWQLSEAKSIPLVVKYTNNSNAAGVVIKLFTYSTEDPHASLAPTGVQSSTTEPVANALIETLITDVNGAVTWDINLPVQLASVLAVISDGSNTSSQIVALKTSGTVTLNLAN